MPGFKTFGSFVTVQARGLSLWRFLVLVDICKITGPARIFGHDLALFQHDSSKFVNAELRDEEFDSSRGAVLLFAQSREHARDRLSNGQEIFFGQKFVE